MNETLKLHRLQELYEAAFARGDKKECINIVLVAASAQIALIRASIPELEEPLSRVERQFIQALMLLGTTEEHVDRLLQQIIQDMESRP